MGVSSALAGGVTDLSAPQTPGASTETVSPAFGADDLNLCYQPVAATGRLVTDRSVASASFAERRWPLIVRSLLWRRELARRSAPVRADEFIPRLKTVFADEGIPPQLAWVAEVESSFDPEAGSPAGARGLFQFMPRTAKQLGLDVEGQDERTSPDKCGRAAARYLGQLYRRFGDWALALAAYNAGEGRVGRLLRRHHAVTFDEIAAFLPPETQLYVPKVMATLTVRENIQLGALPPPAADRAWN